MSFNSWLSTISETKELHSLASLRSRYYKANYEQAKAIVLDCAKQMNTTVRNIDDTHREILIQSNKYHIVVSFVQVNPIETSIDFKVQIYGIVGRNRPQKMILKYYDYLNSNLTFKGVGLHP